MVLLILVQRGKGGGLTGALGGPGGQSAFGTKAGDLFTRITIVAAACWIFLLAFCTWWYTESDFAAALANEAGAGAGQMMPTAGDAGAAGPGSFAPGAAVPATPNATGDASVPVVPSGESSANPAAKPAGEVDAIDMPKSSETSVKDPVKDSGQPATEPAEPSKTAEPSKEPEAAKPAEKPETEAPKTESSKKDTPSSEEPASPSKPPELTPPEPAAGEPKADTGAPPS